MNLTLLSKDKFSYILIFISIILGLIAYEINLYYLNFYNFLLTLQLLLLLTSLFVKKYINLDIDKYLFIYLLFYYFSFLISIVVNLDFLSLFRFIIFPFVFVVSIYISDKLNFYFKSFIFINILPALLNFLVFFNGAFLLWDLKYGRGTSIYFDPNFCAAILGLSAFLSLMVFKRFGFILFLFFISAMFLTYSKSAILSSICALVVFLYLRYKIYITLPLVLFSSLVLFVLYSNLDLQMFRLEQGMNSRDNLWNFAFDVVILNGEFLGVGASNLADKLINNGFENTSTHNNFIDILLQFGIMPFILIILLSVYTFFWGMYNRNILTSAFVFMLVMSLSITFTVGGLGILSLIYTILLISIILNKKLLPI